MSENEILALLYGSWEGIFQQGWARDGFSYPVVGPEGFEALTTFSDGFEIESIHQTRWWWALIYPRYPQPDPPHDEFPAGSLINPWASSILSRQVFTFAAIHPPPLI
jgi:hypothetical protein